MKLHDLVDELELPSTRVAEGAWDVAARRVRRRHTAIVAVTAAAAAFVVLAATQLTGNPDGAAPPANPSTTLPTPSTQQLVTPEMGMPPAYAAQTWDRLVQDPLVPPEDAPSLSENPIPYAKLGMTAAVETTEVFLLGPDDQWRRLDVPLDLVDDGSGYMSSPLRSTSLSPSATMLALPQPSKLVVVDLTDGTYRQIPVPHEYLTYANWLSDSLVVVSGQSSSRGWAVDLDTEDVSASRFGPSTAVAPGGGLVTWGMGEDGFATEMQWDDGTVVRSKYNNTASPQPHPPLVGDEVVVGHHATTQSGLGLPIGQNAVVVVDRHTGAPRAYLPTVRAKDDYTTLLSMEHDKIVLSLVGGPNISNTQYTVVLAAWDWQNKTLEPLATIHGWAVAWGAGW